jgi:hypothetical protein
MTAIKMMATTTISIKIATVCLLITGRPELEDEVSNKAWGLAKLNLMFSKDIKWSMIMGDMVGVGARRCVKESLGKLIKNRNVGEVG